MHDGSLRHENVLQVLLDARGLKRLILSFERKVTFRLSCAQLLCQGMQTCGKAAACVQILVAYRCAEPCVRLIHIFICPACSNPCL